MAGPRLEHNDYQIIKQCIEAATFQGNSVRMVAQLLDKIDAHIQVSDPSKE